LKLPVASYRESSTVRNADFFWIRSLTPQQAAGNALAFAVQGIFAGNLLKAGLSEPMKADVCLILMAANRVDIKAIMEIMAPKADKKTPDG
jgi:hypothetical protein